MYEEVCIYTPLRHLKEAMHIAMWFMLKKNHDPKNLDSPRELVELLNCSSKKLVPYQVLAMKPLKSGGLSTIGEFDHLFGGT